MTAPTAEQINLRFSPLCFGISSKHFLLTIAGYQKPNQKRPEHVWQLAALRMGAYPMKLLLLAIIIGVVVLLSYFGEPVSRQPADQGTSPS